VLWSFLLEVETGFRNLWIDHDCAMTARSKPIDDDWWTLAMVGAYLKLGKRALWDIRRDSRKGFPKPIRPGGKICLFRADEVRGWALSRRGSGAEPGAQERPAAPVVPIDALQTGQVQQPVPTLASQSRLRKRGRRAVRSDDRQLDLF